jgi:two-component system response regulator HydG
MEDVPLLAKHFVQAHAPKRKDILIKCISGETMSLLLDHAYPGNVRELENIIERAISFANTPEILPSDLPQNLRQATARPLTKAATPRLREALSNVEKDTIVAALLEHGGNISRAAASLGIYRQQLQRKIKQYNIAT